jgi:hypothetical protein
MAWLVRECDFRNGVLLCAVSAVTILVAAVRLGSLKLNEGVTRKVRMSTVRQVGRRAEYLALITGDRARCAPRALLGRGLFLNASQLN